MESPDDSGHEMIISHGPCRPWKVTLLCRRYLTYYAQSNAAGYMYLNMHGTDEPAYRYCSNIYRIPARLRCCIPGIEADRGVAGLSQLMQHTQLAVVLAELWRTLYEAREHDL